MEYKNIIVRMPNWLGDIVMATPILKALRNFFPDSKITLMCQHPSSAILQEDPNVDEIFSFKRSKPIFFRRDTTCSITDKLKIGNYDLGILLTNSFSSAWWFFQGNVKERIGYKNFPRDFLLTKSMKKPSKHALYHQVDEYADLLRLINVSFGKLEPKLYLKDEEVIEAKQKLFLLGINFDKKIIGVCAGASYGTAKRWPKEYFIELLKMFSSEFNPPQFIFLGDASTSSYIDEICVNYPMIAWNLSGKTTLRELMSFISLSDLFLTNDSGPMHMAAALDKKVLALFGSTSKERTGPYRKGKVLYEKVFCSPCYRRTCPLDFRCMKQLTPEKVFHEIQVMLH